MSALLWRQLPRPEALSAEPPTQLDAFLANLAVRHPSIVREIGKMALVSAFTFKYLEECARSGDGNKGGRRKELWAALSEEERTELAQVHALAGGLHEAIFLKVVEQDRLMRIKFGISADAEGEEGLAGCGARAASEPEWRGHPSSSAGLGPSAASIRSLRMRERLRSPRSHEGPAAAGGPRPTQDRIGPPRRVRWAALGAALAAD